MANQILTPDTIVSSSNVTAGTATTTNLGAQDTNWTTASTSNVASTIRVGFPTPTPVLTSGAGLQTITVQARKNSTNTGTPTFTIAIWETGGAAALATSSAQSVTAAPSSSQNFTFTWNSSLLTVPDGSALEVVVTTTPASGGTSVRNSIDYGYIAWTTTYATVVRRQPRRCSSI
jgi:hypothetical protein